MRKLVMACPLKAAKFSYTVWQALKIVLGERQIFNLDGKGCGTAPPANRQPEVVQRLQALAEKMRHGLGDSGGIK
jgi:hypothetical protein